MESVTDRQFLDLAWVLLCAILVFMMQAGFTCLEAGTTRAKNSINVAVKNMGDFVVTVLAFWLVGYGIMFGPGLTEGLAGWIGGGPFMPSFEETPSEGTVFLFQAMFCATAATIVSGAAAERMRFVGYMAITLVVALVIYPLIGHWAWSPDGWLAGYGFVDFAGSTVVHSTGGWLALAAVIVLGPRRGRFAADGTPRVIQGSDQPLAVLGVLLLYLGWFGFNGGSTLALDGRVPGIIVHTVLAGAGGALAAALVSYMRDGLLGLLPALNGTIAGLVAVTAGAHAVSAPAAVMIGAVGGLVMLISDSWMVKKRIDDVVSAVPAHLVAGAWGTIAVGIFGKPDLLGTGLSRVDQILVQIGGVVTCGLWAFGFGYVVIRLLDRWLTLRVPPDDEDQGLNVTEHGATTDLVTLFRDLEEQASSGDLSQRLHVEPFTEVGRIALRYNRVMDALQSAVAKSDTIVRSARDAIITFASNSLSISTANPAAVAMFGYPGDAMGRMALGDLLTSGSASRPLGEDTGGRITRLMARRADGSLFPVEVAFSAASDPGPEGFSIALLRDISERERVERALQDSEERYALAMASANDGLYDWNIATGEVTLSPRLAQIFGEPTETEMTARGWASRVHPDDHDWVMATMKAHIKGYTRRFVAEYRFRSADRGHIWLRHHGLCRHDGSGWASRMVGSVGDITERKVAQETLANLLDSIPLPMVVSAREGGQVLLSNSHARKAYGLAPEGTGRRMAVDCWRSAEDRAAMIAALDRDGRVDGFESCLLSPDGEELWVLAAARPITYEGTGAVMVITSIINDRKQLEDGLRDARQRAETALAELKAAQDTLVQSEKMASLGSLVAGVAHEINTPVGIVLTAATHLQNRTSRITSLFEENAIKRSDFSDYLATAAEATAMMASNISRAADLINSFKQVAVDQTSDTRRRFELKPYIDEVLLSLGPALRKTTVTLVVDCPDNLELDSFPGAISQVLTNLVMNALMHAFPEGWEDCRLIISVQRRLDDPVEQVVLRFADTGRGIPEGHLKRIFDPFFTTRRGSGGSGLGLNIVYNLATRTLCGKIAVESPPGQGAVFTLIFPRVTPSAPSAPKMLETAP